MHPNRLTGDGHSNGHSNGHGHGGHDEATSFMDSLPSAKTPERQELESDVRLWMERLEPELRETAEWLLAWGRNIRPDGISTEHWRARTDALRAEADKAGFRGY